MTGSPTPEAKSDPKPNMPTTIQTIQFATGLRERLYTAVSFESRFVICITPEPCELYTVMEGLHPEAMNDLQLLRYHLCTTHPLAN